MGLFDWLNESPFTVLCIVFSGSMALWMVIDIFTKKEQNKGEHEKVEQEKAEALKLEAEKKYEESRAKNACHLIPLTEAEARKIGNQAVLTEERRRLLEKVIEAKKEDINWIESIGIDPNEIYDPEDPDKNHDS